MTFWHILSIGIESIGIEIASVLSSVKSHSTFVRLVTIGSKIENRGAAEEAEKFPLATPSCCSTSWHHAGTSH